MEGVQRLALLCTTGPLKTIPTAALEKILNTPSIDLVAKSLAAKSAGRLIATNSLQMQSQQTT